MENSDITFTDIIKGKYDNINPSDTELDALAKDPYFVSIMISMLIWVLIGLVAFITSIVCFTRSGTAFDKVMGLLLALFFGPFYFLFFAFNKSYCK